MGRQVACVMGTRPEVVKMAPVIARLRRGDLNLSARVVATGQHRGLLDQALHDFDLTPDLDLALMRPGQDLPELTARVLVGLSEAFRHERPDYVLAQGDTTTVFCTALACRYAGIRFGHVEAGLRTGQANPFPEETNRVLTGQLADLHFAPTATARRNLLREGVAPAAILVTGNPGIDALRWIAGRIPSLPVEPPAPRFLLVTAHRRENLGAPLSSIASAVADLTERHPELGVVWPVHPNPAVRESIDRGLSGRERSRIRLIEPVGYPEFVALMKASYLILTDSGGVQEEAPSLGRPVLVLRDATERPEAVDAGAARLVGTDRTAIVDAVEVLLSDPAAYDRLARVVNPFGDGQAAERIALAVAHRLSCDNGGTEDRR